MTVHELKSVEVDHCSETVVYKPREPFLPHSPNQYSATVQAAHNECSIMAKEIIEANSISVSWEIWIVKHSFLAVVQGCSGLVEICMTMMCEVHGPSVTVMCEAVSYTHLTLPTNREV